MNFEKSYKMVPVLIGLTTNYAFGKTEMLFSEEDIIGSNFLKIAKQSIIAQNELQITSNHFKKIKFEEYCAQWNLNTMFSSNPRLIIEDINFQNIIKMGEEVIPFILIKIEKEPSLLVWALNIITQKQISQNEAITIKDACKLWVRWGRKNKII